MTIKINSVVSMKQIEISLLFSVVLSTVCTSMYKGQKQGSHVVGPQFRRSSNDTENEKLTAPCKALPRSTNVVDPLMESGITGCR